MTSIKSDFFERRQPWRLIISLAFWLSYVLAFVDSWFSTHSWGPIRQFFPSTGENSGETLYLLVLLLGLVFLVALWSKQPAQRSLRTVILRGLLSLFVVANLAAIAFMLLWAP